MSQTIQEKLDKIYDTKLQIKTALGTSSDVFEDYPAYIRDLTYGGAVSYSYLDERLSYYVETTDLESMGYITDSALSGYATESYVANYVYTYAPSPDLSAYVTKTELNNAGYISSIPSDYATYTAIEAMGYITINDVPVINENIIPKENSTYTLGDSSHRYFAAYVSNIFNPIWFSDTTYVARQIDNVPSYLYIGSNRPWKIWERGQEINVTSSTGNKWFRFTGYNSGTLYNVLSINENSTTANSVVTVHSPLSVQNSADFQSGLTTTNAYISSETYLPVNTYWWDGTSYHWLGSLFS